MILRLALVLAVVCTAVFALLYLYFREGVRERYAEDWVMAGRPGDRDAWIATAAAEEEAKLRLRLAIAVYGIPFVGVFAYGFISDL